MFKIILKDTFYMVGGEGIWGLTVFAVVLPILNFIPCDFYDGCVDGYMERVDIFIE